MARQYKLTLPRRAVNVLVRSLLRAGAAPKNTYLLSVRGRKSGQVRSTPVNLVEQDGQRWIVAPYGAVNWVRNARAAGQVTLSRSGRSETARIEEIGAEKSAPILKSYVRDNAITRPYFTAAPEAPVEAFAAEATAHPVFRVLGPA